MHNQEVTSYIDNLEPKWQREVIDKIRQSAHQADPEIEEAIKWGSPTFSHNGPVLWVFSADGWVHVSFPHGELLDSSHGLFEKTDSKGQRTIKLREKDNFPQDTFVELLRSTVKNNVEGKRVSFSSSKPGTKTYKLDDEYKKLIKENNLLNEFTKRPYYQQSGWIRWIESAKKPKTQDRRKKQMLEELASGETYMKMPW